MIDNEGINPATGLPMVGGVDIKGNLYGSGSFNFNDICPAKSQSSL